MLELADKDFKVAIITILKVNQNMLADFTILQIRSLKVITPFSKQVKSFLDPLKK